MEHYTALIYYHGPKTEWTQKIAATEIIAKRRVLFRWLARLWVQTTLKTLNAGRCGWAIVDEVGTTLEHVPATDTELG